ncbi:MAG: protease-like activity factor CPAF, partial [Chlamydiia bacterium]|nr:protease-like activity factor CPAF [Chlamydiia bacterium]
GGLTEIAAIGYKRGVMKIKSLIFSWMLFTGALGVALDAPFVPTHQEMLVNLDFVKTLFDVNYAPREWKKKRFGWDLNKELAIAKSTVNYANPLPLKDFHYVLKRMLASTHDMHVSVLFHSTERASLPFAVRGVDGHYYIVWIDEERLSPASYRIEVGDELLSFDGKPTQDVIKELMNREFTTNTSLTTQALTERMLTRRIGALGHKVPTKPITLTVKHKQDQTVDTYQLSWIYRDEKIRPLPVKKTAAEHLNMLLQAEMPFAATENPYASGHAYGFLPDLGEMIWSAGSRSDFRAYIYKNDAGKRIGCIRIPHYIAGVKEFLAFKEILKVFQNETDALVIDQLHNPGGNVFYLYSLASMLTNRPLVTPRHRMAITQADVELAIEILPLFEAIDSDQIAQQIFGKTWVGLPVNHQFVQFFLNYQRFVIDQWSQGKTLTDPIHLYGVDQINPSSEVRYTKPIMILVDQLCFSAGDFFPAIMQDNKKATIFGVRTSGAGGLVREISYPNLLGINAIHYTASIAERIDLNPIEDLGVKPDIPYTLTKEDLQGGYHGYIQAVNEAVSTLLK